MFSFFSMKMIEFFLVYIEIKLEWLIWLLALGDSFPIFNNRFRFRMGMESNDFHFPARAPHTYSLLFST